jgi:hypothetical protein
MPLPGLEGVPGIELVPMLSAPLKRLNAALFSRPTGGPLAPAPPAVRGLEAIDGRLDERGPTASSREPNGFQLDDVPEKRTG